MYSASVLKTSKIMEGIGSRTGRPSSRYGSAPVFTGPVRRWQKQWVHMSQSSSSPVTTYSNNNSSSIKDNVSAVRVRRWTPVGVDKEEELEERPRRKIRYAPIVVLEGKKKEVEKGDDGVKEVSKTNQSTAQGTSENEDDEKKSLDKVLAAKTKASEKNVATEDLNNQPMDFDIGDDEDRDLGGAPKVADWVKAAQRGFAH